MGQTILVAERIEAGRTLIDFLSQGQLEVSVAYWMYFRGEDEWSLVLTSSEIDRLGLQVSYILVIDAIKSLPDIQLTPDDIILLRRAHPLASAIQDFVDRHPEPGVIHLKGTILGEFLIDDAYIYPKLSIH